MEPVIIVGAGIGGLATALALKQAGIETRVFEQSKQLQEVGAGLTLWANGVKVLRKLGIEEFTRASFQLGSGDIYSWQGQRLSSLPAGKMQRRFGANNLAIHRADLQATLLQALGPDQPVCAYQCTGFEQDNQGVTAHFANGTQVHGSALIGADGLYSVVRSQLFGPEKPRYAGYTAWRGVTTPPAVNMQVGEYWGRGLRFGLLPLTQDRYYWFAAHNAHEGARDCSEGRKREVIALFTHWYASVPAIIEATPESAILRNDIYDRPPLTHWTQGRVTLLGDAAHPMTPNLGQGACQALEDALVLAHCLEQTTNINVALQLYQARRIPRTTQMVNQSWHLGRIAQWKNPLLCKLRDTGLRWTPSSLQLATVESALGYEV